MNTKFKVNLRFEEMRIYLSFKSSVQFGRVITFYWDENIR